MEEDAQIKILFVLSKTVVFLLLPSNFHCSDGCRRLQTAENAVFSRTAVAPKPDERWLLVTSAAHMHCDCLFPSGFCGVLTPSRFWGTSRYQCIVQSACWRGGTLANRIMGQPCPRALPRTAPGWAWRLFPVLRG